MCGMWVFHGGRQVYGWILQRLAILLLLLYIVLSRTYQSKYIINHSEETYNSAASVLFMLLIHGADVACWLVNIDAAAGTVRGDFWPYLSPLPKFLPHHKNLQLFRNEGHRRPANEQEPTRHR